MEGIGIIILYFFLVIGITSIFTKREMTTEGLHVSDRNMNAFSSGMSIAATWIWAPSIFVSAERAYINGLPGLLWFTIPNVICLIIFIPFAKLIRKQMPEGITLSGYMEHKYKSKEIKNLYLFQLIMLAIFSTAVNLLAGGKIISSITNIPFPIVTVILSIIAYSYSQFSGIKAAVITDTFKMIIIIIGSILLLPWIIKINGGIKTLAMGVGGINREYTSLFTGKGVELFLAFGLPTTIGLISGPFGDQCFWQRAFAIKEEKIGRAFFIGALLFSIMPLTMGAIGLSAAGIKYIANDPGMVNYEIITKLLPDWSVSLFIFIVLSGVLSTVDSNLCAISSLTTDFKKGTNIKISKLSMAFLLILGIIIANIPGINITYLFLFYGTLRSSTLLPTVMTLLGKKLNPEGITKGIKTSLIIGLPIFAYGSLLNIPEYKTMGSLVTVLLSGIIALKMISSNLKYNKAQRRRKS